MNNQYKYDPSDFTDTDSEDTTVSNTQSDDDSNISDRLDGSTIGLLPMTIIAVYAFVDKAAVLAAIQGIVGAGGLATAITTAFYVAGVITVGTLGIFALLTVVSLLLAVIYRSMAQAIVGVLGLVLAGLLYGLATFVFTGVPLLVGIVIGFNALVYTAVVLSVAFIGVAGLIQIE